jgi:hypothetical protein
MKAKKYNYGGKMDDMGQMAMVKAPSLEDGCMPRSRLLLRQVR